MAFQADRCVNGRREHYDRPSCWRRHPPRHMCKQQRAANLVHIASDQHCCQGGRRGHRQQCLGQAGLHVLCLLVGAWQPHHRDEREVPEENQPLGTSRLPPQLLHIITPTASGVHREQTARVGAVKPVVDHHIRDGASDRLDQHHVGAAAGQVVADHPSGDARVELDRHDHCHVRHRGWRRWRWRRPRWRYVRAARLLTYSYSGDCQPHRELRLVFLWLLRMPGRRWSTRRDQIHRHVCDGAGRSSVVCQG